MPDPAREPANEQKDVAENLECIRSLRREAGWGVFELTFKGWELNEAITSISKKPKLSNNC